MRDIEQKAKNKQAHRHTTGLSDGRRGKGGQMETEVD